MENFFCFLCLDWTKSGKELNYFLGKKNGTVSWMSYKSNIPAEAFVSAKEKKELTSVIKSRGLVGSWWKSCNDGFIRLIDAPEPAGRDDGWRQIDKKWWKCPEGHTAKVVKNVTDVVCGICGQIHLL